MANGPAGQRALLVLARRVLPWSMTFAPATIYPKFTMSRVGSAPFAFPEFHGATRRLVLANLCAYFVLLLANLAFPGTVGQFAGNLVFRTSDFVHGALWQPLTYSFVHPTLLGTLFELLSLWFLASMLETGRGASWVTGLYAASVLGTALAAAAIYLVAGGLRLPLAEVPL